MKRKRVLFLHKGKKLSTIDRWRVAALKASGYEVEVKDSQEFWGEKVSSPEDKMKVQWFEEACSGDH